MKPVEHNGSVNSDREVFNYGLETSISETSGIPRAEKEINKRFHYVRHAEGRKVTCAGDSIQLATFFASLLSQFLPRRSNIFDSNHPAPYSRKIKPLDRNFQVRSQLESRPDVIFYGYLP